MAVILICPFWILKYRFKWDFQWLCVLFYFLILCGTRYFYFILLRYPYRAISFQFSTISFNVSIIWKKYGGIFSCFRLTSNGNIMKWINLSLTMIGSYRAHGAHTQWTRSIHSFVCTFKNKWLYCVDFTIRTFGAFITNNNGFFFSGFCNFNFCLSFFFLVLWLQLCVSEADRSSMFGVTIFGA